MDNSDYLPNVREQYEELPYPARNPLDETKRLRTIYCDCFDRVNHYCYSGRKDFMRGTRVLVAAGGTGDSLIFIAEQLRDTDSDIVYLDFSKASMDVARERADIRGLENITWVHDSLLNIPSLNLGPFDYINCTGALHHLEEPIAGLRALKSVLGDDGAMTLMVYARYGRTATYQIQSLMQLINQHEPDMQVKIDNCRKVLDALPSDHWHTLSNYDHKQESDTEIYDRFLHSQDRSYSIPELYDFTESADLKIVHMFPYLEYSGNNPNIPGMYIKDEKLAASIRNLDSRQQQAIAELMHGRIIKHTFYAANEVFPLPGLDNLEYIPSLPMHCPGDRYNLLNQLVSSSNNYVDLDMFTTKEVAAKKDSPGFQKTPNSENFFMYLNGERRLKDIYDAIISTALVRGTRLSYESLTQEFSDMFSVMTLHNLLHLRHETVPGYKTSEELQLVMKQ